MMRYVQQIHCSVFFGSLLLAEQHTNLFIAQWWVLWRPFRDLGQYLGTNNPKLLFSWWGENTNVLCLDTVHQPVCLLRWPRAQCLFIEMRCGSCELCLRPVNNREVCGSHVQTKTWLYGVNGVNRRLFTITHSNKLCVWRSTLVQKHHELQQT